MTGQVMMVTGRQRRGGGWALSGLAWVVGLLFVLPVLWMALTSFHAEEDAAKNPPDLAAPLTLDGYRSFFDTGPWPSIANSLTASILSTALVILLAIDGQGPVSKNER